VSRRSRGKIARGGQQGAALIVVLMLLLIVTLLGLASMRGAILQERRAGATYGRSLAFQAAEAALREGEAFAAGKPALPAAGCTNGICARTAPGATPAWVSSSFWTTAGNFKAATTTNDATSQYSIQDYGLAQSDECAASTGTNPLDMSAPPCTAEIRVYRIVARSVTPSGAEVMLQSLYRAP
jgi:type IV pilus assembly protein PilX